MWLEKSDDKIKNFGERIHVSSSRAENMINDMLSVMNYSGDALKITLERTSVDEFFTSCIDSLMPLVEQNQMFIKLDLYEYGGELIEIDTYLINRCVENLVLNAIKYSDRKATLIVSVGFHENGWSFNVSDNGKGLPEDKEDIFEMHKKGSDSSRTSHGIGLSFCRMVVEAHNGTIKSYRNKPNGAVFEVILPR